MFIGHWSAAFAAGAASKSAPRLGTLFIAAQLVDWACFILVIAGVEHSVFDPDTTRMMPYAIHMPITHSLLGTAIFAAAYGLIVFIGMREWRPAVITALVVLSHWPLDLLVHAPDLTLAGKPPMLGLGLWNYPWIAIPLELAITGAAIVWYNRRTIGPPGPLAILAILILVMQLAVWLMPPVPADSAVAAALLALASFALISLVAWWVGTTRRHRRKTLAVGRLGR